MEKKFVIALTLFISGIILFAQNQEASLAKKPLNNIYLSTLGADLTVVAINYERLFLMRSKFFLTVELGIGYNKQVDIWESGQKPNYLTFPHHLTMNVGKRKSFFEYGIGGTLFLGEDLPENKLGETVYYDIYPIIGYRLHPLKSKKVNFRVFASFPPSFIISEWETLTFWWFPLGVGLGIGF